MHMANQRRPVTTVPSTEPSEQSLDDRYGVRSPYRRALTFALLGLVVVAFLSWLVWAALGQASAETEVRVRSYDVVSQHKVRVLLDVHRVKDSAAVCTISAQAADHSVVGEERLPVSAGPEADFTMTVSITTDRKATTAVASGCS